MPSSKAIIFTFLNFRETTQSPKLANGRKPILSLSQNLMRVCLMPNIPNQSIIRNIKNIMQSNRKFNSTQRRSQMPWIFSQNTNNIIPYLFTKQRQLLFRELFYIFRRINPLQQITLIIAIHSF